MAAAVRKKKLRRTNAAAARLWLAFLPFSRRCVIKGVHHENKYKQETVQKSIAKKETP